MPRAGLLTFVSILLFAGCEEKSSDRRITLVLDQARREPAADAGKAAQQPEKPADLAQPPLVGVTLKPKPTAPGMSYLRANLNALVSSMREKGLLPGDPAAIVRSVEKLEQLINANKLEEADRELTRSLDLLAKFRFTEEFIEKKMQRLDRLSRDANTTAEVDEQIAALLAQANQHFLAGNLDKTNRVLNDIYRLIMKAPAP